MTEEHIRRAAGEGWLARAWLRLHEPRIISAVYGVAYAATTLIGVWTTVSPPRSIEGETGPWLMAMITLMVAAGGLFGVVTVALGLYWAERSAVALTIGGLALWGGMTIYLQLVGAGNRGLTLLACLLSIGFFGVRTFWISARPYSPRIHPVPTDAEDQ